MTKQTSFPRRQVLQQLGAGLLLSPVLSGWANDYPTKSIELVVPAAAGGGSDVLARNFAEIIKKLQIISRGTFTKMSPATMLEEETEPKLP